MSEYLFHLSYKYVSIEWKIENFSNRKNGCLQSPKFQLSDSRFTIEMLIWSVYTQLRNEKRVSLYLREDSSSDVSVQYSIRLKKSVDGSDKSVYFNNLFPSEEDGWGSLRFIEKLKFTSAENLLLSDGTLTVFCEARVMDKNPAEAETQTSVSDTLDVLSRTFKNMFVSGCDTDAIIDVKGKKFSVHRSFLSARSSVFRSMFGLDMNEKETGVINITDCDPESFGSFLLFLYNGNLDVVTIDNALDLYVTAEKYNVQDLKKACREYIIRDICNDSVCDVVYLAELHEDQELLTGVTDYFVRNASEILETSKWQTFVVENFTMANELLIKMARKVKNDI